MNLKTRARNLRKITGWAYQKCLQAIRQAGAAPADLAKAKGWSILRADVLTIAPGFDIEQAGTIQEEEASKGFEHTGRQSETIDGIELISRAVKKVGAPVAKRGARGAVSRGMKELHDPMEELDARIGLRGMTKGILAAAKQYRDPMSSMTKGMLTAAEQCRDPMSSMTKGMLIAAEQCRDPMSSMTKGMLAAAKQYRDPMSSMTKGMLTAAEQYRDPMSSMTKGMLAAAKQYRDPMSGMTKGILAAAERFREPNVLSSMTKGMLDPVEKLGALSLLDKMGTSTATMFREDRLQWLGLHVYDESIPNFKIARAVAGNGLASVIESMAAGRSLDALSYGSIVREPSRAFTSYMERTGDLARATTPRGREVLDLALVLGSTHFQVTSEVTARLLAQENRISTGLSAEQPAAPPLDLLDLERDELVNRAALDEDVSVTKVAESADIVRLAALIRELLTCVVDCNEAARFHGKDDIFSHTNRTARASALLPWLLPRNLICLKEAVEHLYLLIYEGAGSPNLRFEEGNSECGVFRRTEDLFEAVMDLKFLRSKWLCHDLERGGHGADKNYEDVKKVFERLGVSGVPASPGDYQEMYLRLVRRLHSFLAELRERLHRKFS